jgi:ERCC4-type nuclease
MSPIADSREPEEIKNRMRFGGWVVKALSHGDFQYEDVIGHKILVERKAFYQFIADFHSNQLQRQIISTKEDSDSAILLLEGSLNHDRENIYSERMERVMGWHEFWEVLYSLKIQYWITSDVEDTIQRLYAFEKYFKKEIHHSADFISNEDSYIATMCKVPGIGIAKSKALKLVLPTKIEVVNAPVEKLVEAKGIGENLAKRIYSFWRT